MTRPAFEHVDAVGVAHGRQAVGDHDRGAALRHPGERALDGRLGLVVHRGGGLVEHEDRRVAQDRPGDGEPLALAARQLLAPLADHRVVAVGQRCDEARGPRPGRRPARAPRRWRRAGRRSRFSRTVPWNRNTSWLTKPIAPRSDAERELVDRVRRRRVMRPAVGSYSRSSSLTTVLLPAPVAPTMAWVSPAGDVEVEAVQHRRPAPIRRRRRTDTSSNRTAPCTGAGSVGGARADRRLRRRAGRRSAGTTPWPAGRGRGSRRAGSAATAAAGSCRRAPRTGRRRGRPAARRARRRAASS